jgi:hypothetical protein
MRSARRRLFAGRCRLVMSANVGCVGMPGRGGLGAVDAFDSSRGNPPADRCPDARGPAGSAENAGGARGLSGRRHSLIERSGAYRKIRPNAGLAGSSAGNPNLDVAYPVGLRVGASALAQR